ncbi:hypothetical protein ACFVXG_26530 [Kitasatospora sp. NPDC058162]
MRHDSCVALNRFYSVDTVVPVAGLAVESIPVAVEGSLVCPS